MGEALTKEANLQFHFHFHILSHPAVQALLRLHVAQHFLFFFISFLHFKVKDQ